MARFSLRTAELALLSTPRPWIIRHPVVERKARSCCPNIASTEDHRNSLPPIIQIIGVNALQPSPATDFSSSLSWKTFRSSLSPLSLSLLFFSFFYPSVCLSARIRPRVRWSRFETEVCYDRWHGTSLEEIRMERKVESLASSFFLSRSRPSWSATFRKHRVLFV